MQEEDFAKEKKAKLKRKGKKKQKSMHELHLKHENAMNIFYARCLLFQTRLCFNFNELNNTQKI